ncbi:MAG TPA: carboxypeptidase regulatory-like domain-containing protein [Fibrobacteria bacterium]|nr:carboxypeptidase regulatory-like domain-containing protein [Fibrobacteria bacterium]
MRAWVMRAGGLLLGALILLAEVSASTFTESSIQASCDATTGASAKILGISTTTSSATISWSEGEHNGERWFCYGETKPDKCAKVQTRASGSKNEVVTGLKAQTKYVFKMYGVWKGKQKSAVTGSFVTDGSTCGSPVITVVELDGVALTAGGDSLENAIVTLVRKSDNKLMGTDTTDRSGGFLFEADPGTYLMNFAYPPFTPPTTATVTVIAKKPQTLPDKIFKDAFQIGGTVLGASGSDSLMGATVTFTKKADNSPAGTRISDDEGHFNIGLKAGDYLVVASYQGINLQPPVSITVSKDMEIADLKIPGTISLRPRVPGWGPPSGKIPGVEVYRANGVRAQSNSPDGIEVFRTH